MQDLYKVCNNETYYIKDEFTLDIVDMLTYLIFNDEPITIKLKNFDTLNIFHRGKPFGYSFEYDHNKEYLKLFSESDLFTVDFETTGCLGNDFYSKKLRELYIPLIMIEEIY